jgi:predicted small secreted protein
MNTRFVVRFAILASVAILLAGCSSTARGDISSPGQPLQLRLVTSAVEGACTLPTLKSQGPGSGCDSAGTITYELGESLGTITPTSVTLSKDQGPAHLVILELNVADTSTLGNVTSKAIDKNLAIVLDGQVLSAPLVKAPITTGPLTLAFGTASEAKHAAAELSAPAAP